MQLVKEPLRVTKNGGAAGTVARLWPRGSSRNMPLEFDAKAEVQRPSSLWTLIQLVLITSRPIELVPCVGYLMHVQVLPHRFGTFEAPDQRTEGQVRSIRLGICHQETRQDPCHFQVMVRWKLETHPAKG